MLYAEHDPADIDLTRRHFAAAAGHFDLHIVQSSADALALLEKEDFDLVLADLRLPDTSALELLRESNHRNLRVPFIVVTDRGDEEAAAAALKLGAYDYIVKGDAYLTQLPYAIENAISRARLQDSNRRLQIELAERTRAEERIRHLNADLEQRVVQRTRELESANEELEDTAILELIAENAPVTEICARLASLLARRTNTVVSVTAFPPLDRFRGRQSSGQSRFTGDRFGRSHPYHLCQSRQPRHRDARRACLQHGVAPPRRRHPARNPRRRRASARPRRVSDALRGYEHGSGALHPLPGGSSSARRRHAPHGGALHQARRHRHASRP